MDRWITDRWATNRADDSHQPFQRRERAMLRFRRVHSLQEFACVRSSAHNHLDVQRGLSSRLRYKASHTAALAEWPALRAG